MNTHQLFLIFIASISIFTCAATTTEPQPNVIIESLTDRYTFIPSKGGNSLCEVKNNYEIRFRANRTAASATAMSYYNDYIKIDKATGGDTYYGNFWNDDIFFSDSKACLINVSLKTAGSKCNAAFKRTFTKPEFFCKVTIAETYDIENASIIFEIPTNLESRYTIVPHNFNNINIEKHEELKGNKLIITYKLSDIKSTKTYDDSPSFNISAPQFHILGHFKDANEVYKYLYSYVPTSDPKSDIVKSKALSITDGCESDSMKIAKIYDFVHNSIRYIAVENGELGHRPALASDVLEKKYGDCKGSAILIRDMLQSVGIDSRLVWIGDENIGCNWVDVPNISSGNHMIAAAITGDSILYLDGTAKYNPLNLPPVGIQGRQTLIENTPEECIIGHVPLYTPNTNAHKELTTIRFLYPDKLEAECKVTLTGNLNVSFISKNESISPSKRNESYNNIISNMLKGGRAQTSTCNFTSDSTVIEGKAVIYGAVTSTDSILYVDLNPAYHFNSLKFKNKNRNTDGLMPLLSYQEYTVTLNLEPNHITLNLPARCEINNEWICGNIATITTNNGRSIQRRVTLTIKKRNVPLDKIELFNADIQKLILACSKKIMIKK